MGGPRLEDQPTERLGEGELPTVEGLRVGSVLADRYVITRFVARGGMGEVYEAEDRDLGTRVALKTIRPAIANDPIVLARFHREIQVAREVTHPSVCRVFDLGKDVALSFLTMQLLSGETLAARLARGKLDEATAERILEDVVAGLSAAHAAGVIHRDLKPANIMVTTEGRAVITDFGLAIPARATPALATGSSPDAVARETGIAGTPHYMAPELLEGAPPSVASDVYALGLVMEELGVVRWARAVRACRAADPAARPPDAAAVLAMTRPDRRWLVALVVALVVAAVVAAIALWPPEPAAPPPAAIRAPAAAAASFREGSALLNELDPTRARTLLRAAVEAAPDFAPAHAQLAAAAMDAGDPAGARAAAARAKELLAGAPQRWTQAEKLLVDARAAEIAASWAAAAAAWRALEELDPATIDHGLALAYAHVRAGELELARQTIVRLRARAADEPRIDLVEIRIADRAGELERSIELGRSVVAAGEARRDTALVAQGQLVIGTASLYLGRAEDAAAALAAAEQLFVTRGDPIGRAEVMRMRSASRWVTGDLPGAEAACADALRIATDAGDRRGQANAHGSIAVLAIAGKDLDRALEHLTQAQALYRELGDVGQTTWAAQELGSLYHASGEPERARGYWREGLEMSVASGARNRAGDLAHNLGQLAMEEADVGAARLYFDQALASYEAIGELRSAAQAELSVAMLLLARGDGAGARVHAARAETLARDLGVTPQIVAAQAVLASIARADGALDQARETLRAARAIGAELPADTAMTLAITELEVALAQGRVADARAALAAARAADADSSPLVVATLEVAALRLRLAEGDRGAAVRAAARALRTGAVAELPLAWRLDLSVQLAQVERAAGDRAASAVLTALADEAASHGLALAARRARASP